MNGVVLGPDPCNVTCPNCNKQTTTIVTLKATTKTHLFALLLCVLGCCCCACALYCTDCLRGKEHRCQQYANAAKSSLDSPSDKPEKIKSPKITISATSEERSLESGTCSPDQIQPDQISLDLTSISLKEDISSPGQESKKLSTAVDNSIYRIHRIKNAQRNQQQRPSDSVFGESLGNYEQIIFCDKCKQYRMTKIKYETGLKTHIIALCCCFTGLVLCFCLPYLFSNRIFQYSTHYCSECDNYLGVYENCI